MSIRSRLGEARRRVLCSLYRRTVPLGEHGPIVSFSFDTGKHKDRTMTGLTPEKAARRMTEEGADAVGANCGIGIAEYVPVCSRLHASTALPVWIKANAARDPASARTARTSHHQRRWPR